MKREPNFRIFTFLGQQIGSTHIFVLAQHVNIIFIAF